MIKLSKDLLCFLSEKSEKMRKNNNKSDFVNSRFAFGSFAE